MTPQVHPTAIIDESAVLGEGVRVGPYALIGADVELGEGTEVGAHACVEGPSRFGRDNRIFPHACLGFDPQDLKYGGEPTRLEVGSGNVFREFCTMHRGTAKGGGITTIGDDNLFMAYSHVAHDCHVGSRTVFSNAATLAGHVTVGDDAVVGAFSAVHQFCRVGRHAYIGGFSVITRDALPFVKVAGQRPAFLGVNRIGLQRKSFDEEELRRVEAAVRVLVRSGKNTSQALEELREQHAGSPAVDDLIEFVETSSRGIIRNLPGARGTRGADRD
jgi:UDP-N-acetylglucosamine acyltransferase